MTILNRGGVAAEGPIDELLNVQGQTSIHAKGGAERMPQGVTALMHDIAVSGDTVVFSVADTSVRVVIDLLDDAGITLVSVSPKRESLEDYFTALLGRTGSSKESAS